MAQDIYKYTNPVTNETYTYSAVKGHKYDKAVAQAIEYCITTGDVDFNNVRKYIMKQEELGTTLNFSGAAKDALYYVKDVYKVDTDAIKTHNSTNATKEPSIVSPVGTTNSMRSTITADVNANSNDMLTFQYVDPFTGETREGTIGNTEAYNYTKGATPNQTNSSVYYAIEYMLKNGQVDYNNKEERKALESYLESKLGKNIPGTAVKNSAKDALTFFNTNDIPLSSLGDSTYYSENSTIDSTVKDVSTESKEQPTLTEREAAEDYYWNQLYDLEGDTLGADMYNRLAQAEQNAAMSNMQLAEAQYQQAAMDQAAVVKSITDQVKAERMAKLKAGMNEAQIANQDMQIMLNNMNTLNQQVNTLNQNRLAAQQQYNLAQDTAYQQYLNTAAGMAQSAAGFTASGAGDATRQSLLNMYYTDKYGNIYKKSNQNVTGQTPTNTGGNK